MTKELNLEQEAQSLVGKQVSVSGWHEAFASIGYGGEITEIRIGKYSDKREAVVMSTEGKEESFGLCDWTLKNLLEDGKSISGQQQWSRSGMTIILK